MSHFVFPTAGQMNRHLPDSEFDFITSTWESHVTTFYSVSKATFYSVSKQRSISMSEGFYLAYMKESNVWNILCKLCPEAQEVDNLLSSFTAGFSSYFLHYQHSVPQFPHLLNEDNTIRTLYGGWLSKWDKGYKEIIIMPGMTQALNMCWPVVLSLHMVTVILD